LVMALSLLSLVFLLVISLINLVGTDLSLSEVRKERILAKAHARVGMMVAIGEIQKHLGPDTRISATADLLDERIVSGQHYESEPYDFSENVITRDDLQWIDLNEDGQVDFLPRGQRYWTGVWKHRARRRDALERAAKPLPKNSESAKTINSQVMYDSEFDPHPAVEVAWLVSGNEGFQKKLIIGNDPYADDAFVELMDGVYPEDKNFNAWRDYEEKLDDLYEPQSISKLGKYWHPKVPIFESSDPNDHPNNTTWILKAPLLSSDYDFNDETKRKNWSRYLKGEPVLVPKTELQFDNTPNARLGSDRSISQPAYAYWVGDEGVKSKFGMDFDLPSDLLESSSDPKSLIDASLVARKPNFSFFDDEDSDEAPTIGGFGIELPEEAYEDELIPTSMEVLLKLLEEDREKQEQAEDKMRAHFHSISLDAFGVLADIRTGGLKRDLSSAFLNDREINDNQWRLENEEDFWAKDFEYSIYRHKESLYKTVPMEPGVGGNKWNDTQSTELRFEEAILAGPQWSVLGAYHNLYANNLNLNAAFVNLLPDELPRITGDNNIVFDPDGDFLNYLDRFGGNLDQVMARYNFFEEIFTRVEPTNHTLQPVLCEIKYSQVPTDKNGKLALALYPSVALWNPYSVELNVNQLFLEIPIHQSLLRAVDPRDYDRWRKWKMYNCYALDPDSTFGESGGPGGGGPIPGPTLRPPGIGSGYFGAVGGLGPLGPFSRLPLLISQAQSTGHTPWPINYTFEEFYGERFQHDRIRYGGAGNGMLAFSPFDRPNRIAFEWLQPALPENYWMLASATNYTNIQTGLPNNNRRERHLLLRMQNIVLQPGEKAHFTVANEQIWNFQPLLGFGGGSTPKEFLEVFLDKGVDQYPFLCLTDYPTNNPLILKSKLVDIEGTDPSHEGEKFNSAGQRVGLSSAFLEPRGITMYSEVPYEVTLAENYPTDTEERKISKISKKAVWKLGRKFNFDLNGRWIALEGNSLELSTSTNMVGGMKGNGFRIRLQLPGDAKSSVLEQFNLRALVHSFQDGFGDNWEIEPFRGDGFGLNEFDLNPYRDLEAFRTIDQRSTHSNVNLNEYLEKLKYSIKNVNDAFTANFVPYGTGFPQNVQAPGASPPRNLNTRRNQYDYIDLYYLPQQVDPTLTINNFMEIGVKPAFPTNVFLPIGPIIEESSSIQPNAQTSVGDFHDESQIHGPLDLSSAAVLFEIPKMPMLSMVQFRHANLNNYAHGPSYSLGNSYASTQVGRYKVTGLVRGIDIVPNPALAAFDPLYNDGMQELWYDKPITGTDQNFQNWMARGRNSPWTHFKRDHNFQDTDKTNVRDKEVSQEHENVTLDHSFLNNRALLDGYFLSGLGTRESSLPEYSSHWSEKDADSFEPGKRHRPFRNPRLVPYLRINGSDQWETTGYADLDDQLDPSRDQVFKYQTLAADLLLEGAFNVNSTSVDAWISQLSALAGQELLLSDGTQFELEPEEAVFPRFSVLPKDTKKLHYLEDTNGGEKSTWNDVRVLSEDEITLLAHCLVEQIKLRGPFLSYADFANRRVQAKRENVLGKHITEWGWPLTNSSSEVRENRATMLGMRGAVQAAIAEAEINRGGFSKRSTFTRGEWEENPQIASIPEQRFDTNTGQLGLFPNGEQFNYLSSVFGIHSFHWRYETVLDQFDQMGGTRKVSLAKPEYRNPVHANNYIREEIEFGSDPSADRRSKQYDNVEHDPAIAPPEIISWRIQSKSNKKNLSNGEAPDSLMAVENLATGANKPSWLMQSDVLSPIAPVSSARSDTFVIRVMGETWSEVDKRTERILKRSSKSWIELTVQRTPDFVKSDLDAPHRRPHEPFEDRNLNGYWDDDSSMDEHWLDLNENGNYIDLPDLPGVGDGQGNRFRDGLRSDLPLARDPDEEADNDDISIMGINQRFGRKFKIIKFRWLKEQDV
jgi:hypothetical protein